MRPSRVYELFGSRRRCISRQLNCVSIVWIRVCPLGPYASQPQPCYLNQSPNPQPSRLAHMPLPDRTGRNRGCSSGHARYVAPDMTPILNSEPQRAVGCATQPVVDSYSTSPTTGQAAVEGVPVIVLTHFAPTFHLTSAPMFRQPAHRPATHAFASSLEGMLRPPVVAWLYGHTHYRCVVGAVDIKS